MKKQEDLEKRIAELEIQLTQCQQREREQQAREHSLKQTNGELRQVVAELEHRYHDITLLSEMGDLMQGCLNVDEAHTVVAEYGALLFPNQSGGIYVFNATRQCVEAMATWGDDSYHEGIFLPEECWALRRGRPHIVAPPHTRLRCHCLNTPDHAPYLCLPLLAQGKTLGVFHLCDTSGETTSRTHEHQVQIATMMADHVALALANIQLRQHLQEEVIHDPVTGLYNRRYLVEVLERELRQAARKDYPLSVVMIGVDYFKDFNDTHGHEAGNILLRTLAAFFQNMVSQNDLVYRYGGKEFLLVLPGASLEEAEEQASKVYEGVLRLQMLYQERVINGFSVSVGVAGFPRHGSTFAELMHVADAALLQAQGERQHRVVVGRLPEREVGKDLL